MLRDEATPAIVLDVRDYRETSLLVRLLTRTRGCVGAVARSARRGRSNQVAALQPFSFLDARLVVRPAGGLAVLAQADFAGRPSYAAPGIGLPLRSDALSRMAYAGLFAEILTFCHENDPHSEHLFDLSRDFFLGLDHALHPGSFAVRGLLLLLAALGYAPDLGNLPDLPARRDAYLDLVQATVGKHRPAQAPCVVLTPAALRALHDAMQAPPDLLADPEAIVLSRGAGRILLNALIHLIETHLERRLQSARFLREMVLEQ